MKIWLNCQDNYITWNKKQYLLRADARMGLGVFKDAKGHDEPMEYVLNIEPFVLMPGTKWTGIWHIDPLCDNPYFSQYGMVNSVFIADLESRNKPYPGSHLLFQAADPDLHRRMPEIRQEFDFAISGSFNSGLYEERRKAVDLMKEHFTFIDNGKDKPPLEYVRGLNRAKVQFIRSMNVENEYGTQMGEIAQRFFECLGIGPVLTNWVPDLEHTGLVEGEDFLSYKTEIEMMVKMRELIDNEGYRQKIADSGRRKALLYHSYENRLGSIFNVIKEYERHIGI